MMISDHEDQSIPWEERGPLKAMIEVVRNCNLHCLSCPVGNNSAIKFPMMSSQTYRGIIDRICNSVKKLSLFNYGEPFLHPEICEFIKYAKTAGIPHVSIHSNGHFLDTKLARRIIEAPLDELTISLDGIDQISYSKYRVGGNFEKVKNNLMNFISLQRKYNVMKPIVKIQFVIMRHNEKLVPEFIAMCRSFSIKNIQFKTYNANMDLKGRSSALRFIPQNPLFSRYKNHKGEYLLTSDSRRECSWPTKVITVNSDGTIVPCCYDYNNIKPLGSFLKPDIIWWASEARNQFISDLQRDPDNLPLCKNCQKGIIKIDLSNLIGE